MLCGLLSPTSAIGGPAQAADFLTAAQLLDHPPVFLFLSFPGGICVSDEVVGLPHHFATLKAKAPMGIFANFGVLSCTELVALLC